MNVKKIQLKKLASVLLIMAMLFSVISTVGLANDLPEGTAFKATFEDDEKQASSMGGASLSIVEGGFNSAYSLEVSGRTQTYSGAGVDLFDTDYFTPNTSYVVRAKAMFKEGPDRLTLNITHSFTPTYRGRNYVPVANAILQRGVWNYIEGVFFLEENTENPNIYFQIPNSKVDTFYLDDIEILKVVVGSDSVKIGSDVRKILPTPVPKDIPVGTNLIQRPASFDLNRPAPWEGINSGHGVIAENDYIAQTMRTTWTTKPPHVGILQNVKDGVIRDGQGTYTLSGKVKLGATGNENEVEVYIRNAAWNNTDPKLPDFVKVSIPAVSGGDWVSFTTQVNMTWSTEPTAVIVYVRTAGGSKFTPAQTGDVIRLSELYIKDFSLTKNVN